MAVIPSAVQTARNFVSQPRVDCSLGLVLISSGSARYSNRTRAGRTPKLRSQSSE